MRYFSPMALSAALVLLVGCDAATSGDDAPLASAAAHAGGSHGPALNDANGHFYEAVAAPDTDWFTAWQTAALSDSRGCDGHLATVTSAEENAFIASTFPQATLEGYWLGGNQLDTGGEPGEGWAWVTGEPFASYTNWAPGEPNNLGEEDALQFAGLFYPPTNAPEWNDLAETALVGGYVVEYECPEGRVVASARGSGHIQSGGERRTFAFNAREYANGVVQGEFQLKNRAQDVVAHGDITCLSTDGGQAWLGGVFERRSDDAFEGREVSFQVVDNGEGRNAAPDQLSLLTLYEPGGAAIICRDQLPLALVDVEQGNIQVRG